MINLFSKCLLFIGDRFKFFEILLIKICFKPTTETLRLCGITNIEQLHAQTENEVSDNEESLFNFGFSSEEDTHEDDGGMIGIVNLTQYKKKRSKKAPIENQLDFNLF
ncbi:MULTISPECIES: hypothetical protein [Bacillaceae]|uniref:hypothetical protein n=1 Tax=Bacillaceae TaxID=186817 RepID=UPI002A10EA38|nr:hypothetical protein [Cytobacillus sp. IB215316]MDX8362974.1 hypothetical protein [Cytobacillus sp. IB215316]